MNEQTLQLVSGDPVPEDESHKELKSNGQQQDHVVLTPEERAKGFVRPCRDKYLHTVCGGVTVMNRSIAETFARDPHFYACTFCVHCREYLPCDEFVWNGTVIHVGS